MTLTKRFVLFLVEQLIIEQKKDMYSQHVGKDASHSFPVDPRQLAGISDSQQKVASHKISWGKPAEIFECKRDKRCPRCGRRKNEKNLEPFDLSKWGARCPNLTVTKDYRHIQDFTF